MEQSFVLKYHANISLIEQIFVTAEERAWWVDRINKQKQDENKAVESARSKTPSPPRVPKPSRG
jgi:hypothetical protein